MTYELSPGRFGDNLISYIHAKWISYKYGIPLLYKPFIYSDQLVLHTHEIDYQRNKTVYTTVVTLDSRVAIDKDSSTKTLYIVPYFPESKYELTHGIGFSGKPWEYFNVDWEDKKFVEILRSLIAPINSIAPIGLPKDRISVALHIRRGGNHDTPETMLAFPLKFISDDFFITQLKSIYQMLDQTPLYVYLFTDDNNPVAIKSRYESQLKECDIIVDCRHQGNSDTSNVVEDFFALGQFDCLIHSESNFSLAMSRLHDYMISVYPESFQSLNDKIIYDQINIKIKREHKKLTIK